MYTDTEDDPLVNPMDENIAQTCGSIPAEVMAAPTTAVTARQISVEDCS